MCSPVCAANAVTNLSSGYPSCLPRINRHQSGNRSGAASAIVITTTVFGACIQPGIARTASPTFCACGDSGQNRLKPFIYGREITAAQTNRTTDGEFSMLKRFGSATRLIRQSVSERDRICSAVSTQCVDTSGKLARASTGLMKSGRYWDKSDGRRTMWIVLHS